MKVPKQNCRVLRYNLSGEHISKWKQQLLENAAETVFVATDQQSSEAETERIARLEQLIERLTVALNIHKKASTLLP